MLIDSHAHVNFRAYQEDAKEVLQRSLNNGVWVVNVGSQIDTSRHAVELAENFEIGVYAAVGLHPEHTYSQFVDEEETHFKTREEDFNDSAYEKLASSTKVVAIGECGLDYYRLPEDRSLHEVIKLKQIEVFKKQIRFAKKHNKALIIHSRPEKSNDELYHDMLKILEEESVKDMRFVIHSYTHVPEFMEKFLALGAFVSFNGIITFDKTGNMQRLVEMCPLNRLLLETDCPYLTPVPHRGKRNEPDFVRFVAEKTAAIKQLKVSDVAEATFNNAKQLFKL